MLTPPNISSFYSKNIDTSVLYQGDIVRAEGIDAKSIVNESMPRHWMIISKSCDLVLTTEGVTRKQNISVLPLFTIKLLSKIYYRDISCSLSNIRRKIVVLAIRKISSAFSNPKKDIDHLVKNNISKFMYLPPDGNNFVEPMVLDFDLIRSFDASNEQIVKNFLSSKTMQLVSPFREKVAQRFAEHFSSIGIDDEYIRSKTYVAELKNIFSAQEKIT